ncbi:MAG: methyl-accepting chemotaxis protein [Pontibacterium sp.]
MFKVLRIRTRILLGFLMLILLVCGVVMPFFFGSMKQLIQEAEKRELTNHYQQVQYNIDAEKRLATALASFVAEQPNIKHLLAANDRPGLESALKASFDQLKSHYGLRQFQFHTPPATSYLRLHKLAKFGDDLSSFRETVVLTNRDKLPVSGLEKGVAGLGIRGVVPVSVDGKHWGSVEFGFSLGQPFFDNFKKETGVEVALYTEHSGSLASFASTFGTQPLLTAGQLRQAMSGSSQQDVRVINRAEHAVYANQIKDFSGKSIGALEIAMPRDAYQAMLKQSQFYVMGIGIAFLILGSLAALIITRSIVKPLNEMRNAMENIAHGDHDLTRRLDTTGQNELSDIATSFNDFLAKTEEVIKAMMISSANVSQSASGLFSVTEKTIEISHQQQARTDDVAAAVHEMTATAHEVSNSASNASSLTQESHGYSEQGYETVTRSINTINQLAESVSSTVTLMVRVDKQSTDIHTILDVIQGIAEQTNLLALNAAIEAARAGDQGRGFAVVADEVRSLAARTQNSTSEINEMISQLQEGTNQTVSVIKDSKDKAEKTVVVATESGEALQSIKLAVEQINDAVLQIASAAEQQSQVAETINESVSGIADGAHQVAVAADSIMATSSQIGDELRSLMGLVRYFKIRKEPAVELAVARSAHQTWKMRLRSYLDGKSSLTREQATSHKECEFGHWYYGEGRETCRAYPALQALEQPHEQLHQLIGQIIDLKNQGNQAQAERLYHDVCELSDEIVASIDQTINQL